MVELVDFVVVEHVPYQGHPLGLGLLDYDDHDVLGGPRDDLTYFGLLLLGIDEECQLLDAFCKS